MEFKQLRSFIEVVHRGGFTCAAQTLHISQSAVSKQVAQLEQDVGQPLLERRASQLHLTAAGRIVLERGEALLRQRQALLSELDDLSQMGRGELRLACRCWAATHCLPGCSPSIGGVTRTSRSSCSKAAAATSNRRSGVANWNWVVA